ncbi:MAG: sulfite exporter TauE/SafE family protein [Christensenellales bacterium]
MELSLTTYLLVCPLIFLAGFIDSIAGGGGLISLPAYYLAGLPPALAAGTNKMGAFMGTAVATGRYAAGRHIPWKLGIAALLGSLPGSYLGAELLQMLPGEYVKIAVLLALPLIAVFVLLNKDGMKPRRLVPERFILPACFLTGLVIGLYDGLVGPGTGTFLQLVFVSVIGMEVLKASGAARLVNLCSNIGALISLMLSGQVLYALALPAALFGMAGNYLGSTLAIRRGAKFIRVLLICVLLLLMAALAWDVLFGHSLF